MDTRKITLFCYWNGCIKDGYDGPFYQGSGPRVIRIDSKIELSQLLDDLHRLTGFEKGKFQIDLIGRYPSIVQQQMVKYVRLPIVDDCSLEIMLEVPSHHPSINNVELYIEGKPVSDQPTRKRSRREDAIVDGSLRDKTLGTSHKDNSNGWLEDEENMDEGDCGIVGDNADATKGLSDGVSKRVIFSRTWLDERELHVGMKFRDKDELEKAVKLYSNRRQREYIAYEDRLVFTCKIRKVCRWVLKAAETKSNGFEITEYTDPHTCKPVEVGSDFLAGEIKGLIKAQPSLSIAELNKWVKEEFGYAVSGDNMWNAKKKVITEILGDLDKSFSVLPKFMAALCSSNKMLLDWQYDSFSDPKDASFRSLFFAFHQSVEGFPHCRPVILVDTVDLSGKYPGKMLVAAGLDAENNLFPLAFAITTQESSADTWRWFFACIRKKVTQREGLCLITSLNPDIVAAVKEPECQWAQHRFCLRDLCFKFYDVFNNNLMTEFVYKAGSTKHILSFDYYLKKIEEMNPEAWKWLGQIPAHQWALAHDSDRLRFGIMTTNLIFMDYSFINKSRDLPITACILLIFDHLAALFKLRHGILEESLKKGGEIYVSHVMKKLEEYKLASRTHDVLPLDQTAERFQITKVMQTANEKSFVDCSNQVCTCQIWQVYKYPCSHLLAVCRRLNVDHFQYVNDFYKTESFRGVYAADFNLLPGVSDWPETSEVPRLFPPGSCARSVVQPVTTESAKPSDEKNTGVSGQSETRKSKRLRKPTKRLDQIYL